MHESAVNEFPFVNDLPKRERSRLGRIWDHFRELSAEIEAKGMLVPQHVAAELLDVTRGRVWQFVEEGRLESVEIGNNRYVTQRSLEAFAKIERKRTGRPPKSKQISYQVPSEHRVAAMMQAATKALEK